MLRSVSFAYNGFILIFFGFGASTKNKLFCRNVISPISCFKNYEVSSFREFLFRKTVKFCEMRYFRRGNFTKFLRIIISCTKFRHFVKSLRYFGISSTNKLLQMIYLKTKYLKMLLFKILLRKNGRGAGGITKFYSFKKALLVL